MPVIPLYVCSTMYIDIGSASEHCSWEAESNIQILVVTGSKICTNYIPTWQWTKEYLQLIPSCFTTLISSYIGLTSLLAHQDNM